MGCLYRRYKAKIVAPKHKPTKIIDVKDADPISDKSTMGYVIESMGYEAGVDRTVTVSLKDRPRII